MAKKKLVEICKDCGKDRSKFCLCPTPSDYNALVQKMDVFKVWSRDEGGGDVYTFYSNIEAARSSEAATLDLRPPVGHSHVWPVPVVWCDGELWTLGERVYPFFKGESPDEIRQRALKKLTPEERKALGHD